MKLEAGKTYVFKDDAARDKYERGHIKNKSLIGDYYRDGFTLDFGSERGGLCGSALVITDDEAHIFKESKPFDISEYECPDTHDADKPCIDVDGDILVVDGKINKNYAEAIMKHFGLG